MIDLHQWGISNGICYWIKCLAHNVIINYNRSVFNLFCASSTEIKNLNRLKQIIFRRCSWSWIRSTTLTTPWTITSLGSVAIHFCISQTIDDACFVQIIWTHLHFNGVSVVILIKCFLNFPEICAKTWCPFDNSTHETLCWVERHDLSFDLYILVTLCFCHK